uniref:Alpha/beta fold hydrolase n=1 Tax=Haloferax mediterranei TaxID=2252 RepID=UPI0027E5BECC|nr:Chain A, Alpha/beta fold hydrolase [Haloferax mediterranei]8CKP_B Chain B, Alpha/beta fold hydrolase [Haloferax mediterranei]8CKP_C Chain C, Alpha/beta fold hydrolase [Haloferax mediterranei]8CKP_D Chain D, Alpha/beta fold hydrolase [Haloferax mediterranei]8CKP_E Chain E, Alpha/beta fold hydrolase [Haloferax mediterranei]8CKP_F Chain F, Alpha/beta fold hydrolase [Haloferax mediterranei]8CKP_G Chain G, Alpha/beta fold hydrolase [Haloferax mediterranei]8CKP_H Chain H, Alpha/beta fold hydrol
MSSASSNARDEVIAAIHEEADWVDRTVYPFESRCIGLSSGAVHYIDEGPDDGGRETLLMLHGNPTWSFLYRHLVRDLRDEYRCVALDYLGFGLSERPTDFSYRPEDHADVVEEFIDELGLEDVVLVGHDWGGPIGFSYAIDHPENVGGLVVMNTWMWPVSDDKHFSRFSKLLRIGRELCERYDLFTRVIMPMGFADRSRFTESAREQYRAANRGDRTGTGIFPQAILGSRAWLSSLWEQRDNIADIPARIIWGMEDSAFRPAELRTFEALFEDSSTVRLYGVGHYVPEEFGSDLVPLVREFLEEVHHHHHH